MDIASYFDETPPGQESRFGFELGPGDGNCAVKAPVDILREASSRGHDGNGAAESLRDHRQPSVQHRAARAASGPISRWMPSAPTRCTMNLVTWSASYLMNGRCRRNGATPHPGLISNLFNCAPAPPPPPYWMNKPQFPLAKTLPECDLYANGVVHPYDECRMGAMNHRKFCDVCKEAMKNGFAYVNSVPPTYGTTQPQASHAPTAAPAISDHECGFRATAQAQQRESSNTPRPVMRLLVEFDPGSQTAPHEGRQARSQATDIRK